MKRFRTTLTATFQLYPKSLKKRPRQATLQTPELHQVKVGRWALGGNGAQEVAWSTFKQRDAMAKLGRLGRLTHLPA
ncbi:hypothetical protein HPB47_023419 [Ixodes persulcatus]|uniref:Uncharacterized protein n=1 Tax=Ixodes persulcatus TaxID=34615 RepID=A0AC60QAA1_IXOPE|nr:hypothetical protein HPB47_023419 [Ixodes persulcatus]